jgi:hypothetical protein
MIAYFIEGPLHGQARELKDATLLYRIALPMLSRGLVPQEAGPATLEADYRLEARTYERLYYHFAGFYAPQVKSAGGPEDE